MKNRFPTYFRAAAIAALALLAHPSFGQADYSTPYTVSKYAGVTGIAGTNDGTINYAQLNLPIGAAFDASGNLYVADSGNQTIRKISPTGISTTFAGAAGNLGFSDGTGSAARFSTPSGIAVDAAGNVFVSDSANHTIRKISPAGDVTTLAGSAGVSGTANGTGSAARFNNPIGLALTAAGDLLVADFNNHTIRKVTAAGVVTTFAGTAGMPGSSDGTGTGAMFLNPHSLAIDATGNIWVSDSGNHTIRKVTATTGVVTTFAGTAGSSGSANGTGDAARFNTPQGLAFDASGNLFVADWGNSLLRKISPAGAVTTFAGSTSSTRSADGIGTGANFQSPAGLVFDSSGTLHVSDYYNHTIRKVTAAAVVTTWIGSPPRAGSADGIGAAGLFNNPYGIAVDSSRNVYVADQYNHTIRKITAAGVVTTLAGLAGVSGAANGTGSMARFYYPVAVAVDTNGDVYVADKGNHTIRKITATGGVTTLAGSAGNLGTADGTGAAARFYQPQGLTVDASGNVYVADSGNGTIRKITSAGVVTTLAGTPLSFGLANGTGAAARFLSPTGIALDASGNIFVGDTGNGTIRKITPFGVVTTFAGQAGSSGASDGASTAATFSYPVGIAVDAAGNVFVADYGNNAIRLITVAGVVKTVAGDLVGGLRHDDDGAGQAARFADPTGVAVDALGTLYVADSSNNLIRKGLPPGAATFSAQPVSQAAALGQSVTFTLAATGSGLTYQWQKSGANIAGATGASYTVPSPQATDAGSYTVLVTSGGITAASTPATLSVGPAGSGNSVSITTQPASQSVVAGQSVTFTVVASGSGLTYQWQKDSTPISGATNASYTITNTLAADAASYTVVVTSGSTSATSSVATLTVTPATNPGRLINLSVLAPLAPGETMTMGTVLGGAGTSGTKPLLARAAGPSLAPFNVTSFLPDPTMTLNNTSVSPAVVVATNTQWGGSATLSNAFAAVGAFSYTSANSTDSAIFQPSLAADNYTVLVSDASGGSGTVIAELYDATPGSAFTATTPRLINVSVLKQIATGSSLTAGFVVSGASAMKVLIRAVGPRLALAPFNIPGTMPAPTMTLVNTTTGATVATNSGWGGDPAIAQAANNVGAFAVTDPTSKDAMLLVTLAPANYTAQVGPASGTSGGIAIVEVYEVP